LEGKSEYVSLLGLFAKPRAKRTPHNLSRRHTFPSSNILVQPNNPNPELSMIKKLVAAGKVLRGDVSSEEILCRASEAGVSSAGGSTTILATTTTPPWHV
jgi:hypothetical protein